MNTGMDKVVEEFEDWLKSTIEHYHLEKVKAIKDQKWDDVLNYHRMIMVYSSVLAKLQFIKRLNDGNNK